MNDYHIRVSSHDVCLLDTSSEFLFFTLEDVVKYLIRHYPMMDMFSYDLPELKEVLRLLKFINSRSYKDE